MIGVNFVSLCHIFTMSRSPYRESLLNLKKPSRQLFNSYAFFIILYVIGLTQIVSATQPDAFFNVLLNTKIRQSANVFMMHMVGATILLGAILRF